MTSCHEWFKSQQRITKNAAELCREQTGHDVEGGTIVAVHTFEPTGIIAEVVHNGVTWFETCCYDEMPASDENIDGVIDYLWNECVKHEI